MTGDRNSSGCRFYVALHSGEPSPDNELARQYYDGPGLPDVITFTNNWPVSADVTYWRLVDDDGNVHDSGVRPGGDSLQG